MPYTLNTFAARAREILLRENNPAGREKVAAVLRDALQDRAFVESLFDANSPERKVLYEDPDLGFCVLAHRYTGAKDSPPHDHAHSWAIYGQADGETLMTDWALVEPATPERAGKVRRVRDYALTPGSVHVYNEGDLHSPRREGATRLVRIEGVNMEKVKRARFEAVEG